MNMFIVLCQVPLSLDITSLAGLAKAYGVEMVWKDKMVDNDDDLIVQMSVPNVRKLGLVNALREFGIEKIITWPAMHA